MPSLLEQTAAAPERYAPQSVVCVGHDERGHRHIVHAHEGAVVTFLCGRWRPAAQVRAIAPNRRHEHVCITCGKTWDRRRKEHLR